MNIRWSTQLRLLLAIMQRSRQIKNFCQNEKSVICEDQAFSKTKSPSIDSILNSEVYSPDIIQRSHPYEQKKSEHFIIGRYPGEST